MYFKLNYELFANNTTLLASGSNYSELLNLFNLELVEIVDWTKSIFLSLNVTKTFTMVFTNHVLEDDYDSNICFDAERIYFASMHGRLLGLHIDSNLTYK